MATSTLAISSPVAGSLLVQFSNFPPLYLTNLINVTVKGDNPFLPDGVTLNPDASIVVGGINGEKDYEWFYSTITTIGGSAKPATLAGGVTAVANLIMH